MIPEDDLRGALERREWKAERGAHADRALAKQEASLLRAALGYRQVITERVGGDGEVTETERWGGTKDERARDRLPAEVWEVIVAANPGYTDAAEASLLDERDEDQVTTMLEEALAIVTAVVACADARVRPALPIEVRLRGEVPRCELAEARWRDPVWGEKRGRPVVSGYTERCTPAIRVSGGWLPRPVLIESADGSLLGWAVAAWTFLRPRETWPSGREKVDPIREPVVAGRWEGGELLVAWGDLTAAEAARAAGRGRGGAECSLVALWTGRNGEGDEVQDEAVAGELARWTAEAERRRENERLRLPGEVGHLEALGESGGEVLRLLKVAGSADHPEEDEAARASASARDLASAPADSPALARLRGLVLASLGGDDRDRRRRASNAMQGRAAWAAALCRVAARELAEAEERREVELWESWPGEETGPKPGEHAGRVAARWLLSGPAMIPDPRGAWPTWSALRLVQKVLDAQSERASPATGPGRAALADLRARLEDGAAPRLAGLRVTPEGDPHARADVERLRGVILGDLRTAALRELRVALDAAAGLRVTPARTLADARRRALGPEVARSLGRGETVVVADSPPRVLAGSALSIAAAGYTRLDVETHRGQAGEPSGVAVRASVPSIGAPLEALGEDGVAEARRWWEEYDAAPGTELFAGMTTWCAARIAERGRGAEGGSGWRPGSCEVGERWLRRVDFEWRREGWVDPAARSSGGRPQEGALLVRWRGRWEVAPEARLEVWRCRGRETLDLEVEAKVTTAEDGEEQCDLRAWGDLASLDCEPEKDPEWSRLLVADLEAIVAHLRGAT